MLVQIALDNFHLEDTDATIIVLHEGQEIGHVTIFFTSGSFNNQHQFGFGLVNLPHTTQAMIIYEASMMVDSHFDDDAEPYSEKEFEA